MAERQAGVTALITAYARAYHAAHAEAKIFDDRLAGLLFSAGETETLDRQLAGLLPLVDPSLAAEHPTPEAALARVMQIYACPISLGRSRYTEDLLEDSLRLGVSQYVILGAGMDTFAYRRPELAGIVEIYAVDHPATQALMLERSAAAGWEAPANLHVVPLDFTTGNLTEALLQAGYQPGRAALFSELGVSYYLSKPTFWQTLRSLRSFAAPGSRFVWDYMDQAAFDPTLAHHLLQVMRMVTERTGEPLRSGFEPARLAGELSEWGFELEEDLGPREIGQHYFTGRSDAYQAFPHVHYACAKVQD